MRTTRGEPSSDYLAPMAGGLLILTALAGALVFGGSWLLRPTVVPNPGMAAYKPPVGTFLIPPPHKMDAPQLAELPPVVAEPAPAEPTVAKVAEQKPVAAKANASRKRAKIRPPRDEYDPGRTYADSRWGNPWGGGAGSAWGGWNNRW